MRKRRALVDVRVRTCPQGNGARRRRQATAGAPDRAVVGLDPRARTLTNSRVAAPGPPPPNWRRGGASREVWSPCRAVCYFVTLRWILDPCAETSRRGSPRHPAIRHTGSRPTSEIAEI